MTSESEMHIPSQVSIQELNELHPSTSAKLLSQALNHPPSLVTQMKAYPLCKGEDEGVSTPDVYFSTRPVCSPWTCKECKKDEWFTAMWCLSDIEIQEHGMDTFHIANFRPISFSCVLSKILDQLVQWHVQEHLWNFDVVVSKQFGFHSVPPSFSFFSVFIYWMSISLRVLLSVKNVQGTG